MNVKRNNQANDQIKMLVIRRKTIS